MMDHDILLSMSEKIGSFGAKLDAIHEQAVKTNSSVADLYALTTAHHGRLATLEEAAETAHTWGGRFWQIVMVIIAALVAAGATAFTIGVP